MNASRLRATMVAASISLVSLAVMPASAQIVPAGGNRGAQAARRPAPRNYLPELKKTAAAVGTEYSVNVVVDPYLFVATMPTAPDKGITVEKAMDALTHAATQLSWRRVYLAKSQAGVIPPPEKLVDTVRALDKVEQTGLVLENPATQKASTLMKDWNVTQTFKEELASAQFSGTPIYVLYSQKPGGGKPPMEELADMQRRSMEMMMSMDPDQMATAMDQGIQMFMNMDPDTRTRFMGMQMQAGMKMLQNMSPDQRNQLMQSAMQSFQQSGGFPGGAPPGGGGGGRRQ
jgi:hypothetical protein